ncbi:MAG: hypothetical protein ACLQLG_08335 [Thermoguttaceae bacterium]
MSHRGFLVVALAAALAAPVYGQVGPGANLISLDGNIEMMANGLLRMNSKAGQSVLITMSSATKMQYTNKAASEFLRPGLAIEFTAEVDKKHNVKEAISSVTVVSLGSDRLAGLFPEGSASSGPKSAEADNFAFGGGGGKFNSSEPAPAPKSTKGSRKTPAVQLPATCVVRGTIKSLKAGKLILNIGHGALHGDVADGVQVAIDTGDLQFAHRGDAISVRGVKGAGLMIAAQFVSVQGSEPLSGPKKKKTGPGAKKQSSSKKDDSGGDSGESKADKKAADKGN